ncbi:MAG: dockerin type I repeat-containing protein [Clostridia bacterium]|nr:dockerin type I repeat-containing protein [Clostridia bacterium]
MKNSSSDYLNGTDLFISYIGNKNFSFHTEYFDLKVWENGVDGSNGDFLTSKVTKPTCSARGYTTHTCSCCGYSYKDAYTSKTEHKFTAWTVSSSPSCEADGVETRKCSVCDVTETRSISATGHSHIAVITTPTCTDKGYTTYNCYCGDGYISNYVDAIGHSFGNWYITLEPTCLEKGTERRDCTVCDYFETRDLNALGHDITVHEVKSRTCVEIGWNEYETCSRCDYTTYVEIPASGHSYEYVVTTPTCTEKGTERRDCTRCDHYEILEIASLGHDTVHHESKTPTCTESGWESYETCLVCDYTTFEDIPASGHIYQSVITAPTCTKEGYTTFVCYCGDTYVTDYVSALGHDTVLYDLKNPTCIDAGWDAYESCVRCEYTTFSEIPPIGHDTILHEAKNPTCTESGWDEYETCVRCSYSTYTHVPALGHSFGEWITTLEPTCTAIGLERRNCSVCRRYENRVATATGHDNVRHEAKSPTCTEVGWDAYVTCTRCNYTTYKEIPAKGHGHIEGICIVCGEPDPDCGNYIFGDLDGDGKINAKDANILIRIVAGTIIPSAVQRKAADVNNDGRVNSIDANLIVRIAAGLTAT